MADAQGSGSAVPKQSPVVSADDCTCDCCDHIPDDSYVDEVLNDQQAIVVTPIRDWIDKKLLLDGVGAETRAVLEELKEFMVNDLPKTEDLF